MQPPSKFKRYMERNRTQAVTRLLEKAYTANRIAKLCGGKERARLYNLKHSYVISAMRLLPEAFRVDSSACEESGAPVLIGVRSRGGFAFHIPAAEVPDQLHSLAIA